MDEATGQYYYHAFLKEQPDLNWRNPQVVAAMHDVMRFWLRRGVDGFRFDAIWHLMKDDQFRDNPKNPGCRPGDPPDKSLLPIYSGDRPEVHDALRGMRQVLDEFPDRLMIGEIYLPFEQLMTYYGRDLDEANFPFNFGLLQTPWRARDVAALIERYEGLLPRGGWPNWVLGNHDRPRVFSRVGRDAGARRRHAAAHAARHADALLRRRNRFAASSRSRPNSCRTPSRRTCPGLALAATAAAHRCSGTRRGLRDFRRANLGCR